MHIAQVRMDHEPRSLRILFLSSLGMVALAFATGIAYSLSRLHAPPSLSSNPAQFAEVLIREGNLERAVAELEAYEAIIPANNLSILSLAGILSDLGRQGDALNAYRRGAIALPNDPTAHSRLGEVLFGKRRFGEASESFQTVLELDPQYPNARENLAVSELNAGRVDRAIVSYKRVVDSGTASAGTHDMLSRAYEIAGDRSRAFEHAKIAFRMAPESAEFRAHFDQLAAAGARTRSTP